MADFRSSPASMSMSPSSTSSVRAASSAMFRSAFTCGHCGSSPEDGFRHLHLLRRSCRIPAHSASVPRYVRCSDWQALPCVKYSQPLALPSSAQAAAAGGCIHAAGGRPRHNCQPWGCSCIDPDTTYGRASQTALLTGNSIATLALDTRSENTMMSSWQLRSRSILCGCTNQGLGAGAIH